jgi:hypothetical protein
VNYVDNLAYWDIDLKSFKHQVVMTKCLSINDDFAFIIFFI